MDNKGVILASNFVGIGEQDKKWTLPMIFHAIDLSLSNSWLEYQADCAICKIPVKNILDLLHFRQRVADSLLNMGQPLNNRKRKRLSSGSNSPISTPTSTPTRRLLVEMRSIS
ncbi:hypothetical protein EVAR_93237_1 [Eumeta japonica]|uniref:Uncharacterized protein n=1 Tax=Eumeta variegata TaxID=151549 RepID=A0A4C1TXN6_EUMVA|nr:hypothetical protein EVAR_93237_1 [Eumeta japonica]